MKNSKKSLQELKNKSQLTQLPPKSASKIKGGTSNIVIIETVN